MSDDEKTKPDAMDEFTHDVFEKLDRAAELDEGVTLTAADVWLLHAVMEGELSAAAERFRHAQKLLHDYQEALNR